MRHQDLDENHVLESFTYPDAPTRMAATGLVTNDIGRVAYQQDLGTYWRLLDPAPIWQLIAPDIPRGGAAQTILTKNSTADYDTAWLGVSAATHGIPAGGAMGTQLTKNSGGDYDVSWQPDPSSGGGTGGIPNFKSSTLTYNPMTSTSGVMMGFGSIGAPAMVLTPTRSGIVLCSFTGAVSNTAAGFLFQIIIKYGSTFPAPAQGAPPTGTSLAPLVGGTIPIAGGFITFAAQNIIGGGGTTNPPLTLNTQYWFDVEVRTLGGTCDVSGTVMTVSEF